MLKVLNITSENLLLSKSNKSPILSKQAINLGCASSTSIPTSQNGKFITSSKSLVCDAQISANILKILLGITPRGVVSDNSADGLRMISFDLSECFLLKNSAKINFMPS